MRKSQNPFIKFTGYVLIGFFLLIIILSFGMPDIGMNCGGLDQGTVAVVNGQKVHTLDYLRYRDTKFSQFKNQKMDSYILDNYIMEIMLLQEAEKLGIDITEDRITRYIINSPDFKNPGTGEYDPKIFQMILNSNRMNFDEFRRLITRDMMLSDFRFLVSTGAAVASEDIKSKNIAENSRIRIRYAHLPAESIKQNYSAELAVTDGEIDEEIKSQSVKISDPETDRARIKKEIEERKLLEIREKIASSINSAVEGGASFNAAASMLKGKIYTSENFKLGERIKPAAGSNGAVQAIENSQIFINKIMAMPLNSSSPVISSHTGLFIFTPVERFVPSSITDAAAEEKIKNNLAYTSINMITRNIVRTLSEKSKIIKNLKTD
jgi:hypothetical protein